VVIEAERAALVGSLREPRKRDVASRCTERLGPATRSMPRPKVAESRCANGALFERPWAPLLAAESAPTAWWWDRRSGVPGTALAEVDLNGGSGTRGDRQTRHRERRLGNYEVDVGGCFGGEGGETFG
jgi:hypothetical protein